jgi:hypothetical protein
MEVTNVHHLAILFGSDNYPDTLSQRARDNLPGHFPSGTSFRVLNHFRQLILKETFEKYDFGFEENFKRYGQVEPPVYDLRKISKVPIALFCGKGDLLSSNDDFRWTKDELE